MMLYSLIAVVVLTTAVSLSLIIGFLRAPPDTQADDVAVPISNPGTLKGGEAADITLPSNGDASLKFIGGLKYPNSREIKVMEKSPVFESYDSPVSITNWYKEKIKEMGMTTTSFIQTNTNGNIFNSLVASNNTEEVKIEIRKDSRNNTVFISLSDNL